MIAAIDAHGERIPTDEEVELVAARTGLGRGAAVLLLAGAPNMGTWSKDFLGKEIRIRARAQGRPGLGGQGRAPTALRRGLARGARRGDGRRSGGGVGPVDAGPARGRLARPLRDPGCDPGDELKLQADKELPDASVLTLLAAPEADARLRSDGAYTIRRRLMAMLFAGAEAGPSHNFNSFAFQPEPASRARRAVCESLND